MTKRWERTETGYSCHPYGVTVGLECRVDVGKDGVWRYRVDYNNGRLVNVGMMPKLRMARKAALAVAKIYMCG